MVNKSVSIVTEHRDEILHRMRKGEAITAIARNLGYADHSGIIHRLADDPEYQDALRSGIVGKLEQREGELQEAESNVTVTRADRLLGHARWWAERLDPERFGGKQTITLNQGVTLDQALDGLADALLGKMRVVSTQQVGESVADQTESALALPSNDVT